MPNWKKLIVSGSDANLNSLDVTNNINASTITASYFVGDGSKLTNIATNTVLSSSMTIDTYKFVGNGTTTNYILSQSYDPSSLIISVDGLSFTDTLDYTLSSTVVAFINAPPSQSNILIRAFVNNAQGGTGSFSGSFFGIMASASYATTASYALNGGGGGTGAGFPYNGSAVITGSLLVSGSGTVFQVSGSASIRDNFIVNGGSLFVDAANNRVGIGTSLPTVTLQVQGNVSASSFTGSLFGTSSLASNAISSSFATTSSQAINSNTSLYAVTASYAVSATLIKTVEYFDTLTTFVGTKRWWAHTNFTIKKISAFLINASQGADVILQFNKNGSSASTLTIPQTTTYATGSPSIIMNTQDYLTVDITQVGTSQAGAYLTIVFEYQ